MAATQALAQAGVEESLAQNLSALEFIFPVLDLVDLAQRASTGLEQAAHAYFGVEDELRLSAWRKEINRLPTDTLWQTQARGSARDDVYSIAGQITRGLLTRSQTVSDWSTQHRGAIDRLCWLQDTIAAQTADLAPISVALRELRHLS